MSGKVIFDDWTHGRERIRKLHRKMYAEIANNGVCQVCGNSNGKRLEIHHFWLKDSDKYTGLVFVCRKCHSKFFLRKKNEKSCTYQQPSQEGVDLPDLQPLLPYEIEDI